MELSGLPKHIGLGVKMNVKELIEKLSCLSPDAVVIMSSDEEGNSHWNVDGPEEFLNDGVKTVCLWPTYPEVDMYYDEDDDE